MDAKFVVAATRKGGQGKTTIMQNFAVYMSKLPQVHKILLIDLDSQMNLTSDYLNHKNISKTDLDNSCIYHAYEHDAKTLELVFQIASSQLKFSLRFG